MGHPAPTLGPVMRAVLLGCGPMNVAGAVTFLPPVTAGRAALGLPDPHPFYLWLLAVWVLAFGAAFAYQGWTGRANPAVLALARSAPAVLALAAVGKGTFGGLLVGLTAAGELPSFAAAGGLPDLALAGLFAGWLWRHGRAW